MNELKIKDIARFWKDYNRECLKYMHHINDQNRYLYGLILRQVDHWDLLIRKYPGATLVPSQRSVYLACKFLCDKENFSQFLSAFKRLRLALESENIDPKRFDFQFDFSKNLWSSSCRAQQLCLSANFAFFRAPVNVWTGVLQAATRSNEAIGRKISENYAKSNDFLNIVAAYVGDRHRPRGKYHDLESIFDELNAAFFQNKLDKPTLRWNEKYSVRTLGYYNFQEKSIVLSPVLDNENIDPQIVRFIMYHEMLHMVHGRIEKGGRHFAHTPAFRADEKKFPDYERLEKLLPSVARIHKNH